MNLQGRPGGSNPLQQVKASRWSHLYFPVEFSLFVDQHLLIKVKRPNNQRKWEKKGVTIS